MKRILVASVTLLALLAVGFTVSGCGGGGTPEDAAKRTRREPSGEVKPPPGSNLSMGSQAGEGPTDEEEE